MKVGCFPLRSTNLPTGVCFTAAVYAQEEDKRVGGIILVRVYWYAGCGKQTEQSQDGVHVQCSTPYEPFYVIIILSAARTESRRINLVEYRYI